MELIINLRKKQFKRKYNINRKNYVSALIVFFSVMTITFINDVYVRVSFYEYNSELRLIDHLLAGLSIPIILYFILGSFYKRCLFYFLWCSVWEIQQFLQRDFFQLDQYVIDLLGIVIVIILYKSKFIK